MEFHFRSGASLYRQRFTASHQVDQLVWPGTLAGLFVNGKDMSSCCCPVTRDVLHTQLATGTNVERIRQIENTINNVPESVGEMSNVAPKCSSPTDKTARCSLDVNDCLQP